jgi:SAM-dependent methyltransferase
MKRIDSDSVVDLIFQLKWKSGQASHTDCLQASHVNIWRDVLPPSLREDLVGRQSGDGSVLTFSRGEVVPGFQDRQLLHIKRDQFNPTPTGRPATLPRVGRFYPKGLLKGIAGVFKDNVSPFRCVGVNNGSLTADFNHPLAEKDLGLSTIIGDIEPKTIERGGMSVDWMEAVADGPGMQARWRSQQTDYITNDALQREDDLSDAVFYHQPRLVQHIDSTAREIVRNTYGRLLGDGMKVLDLMGSWCSHIPDNIRLDQLTGLGMNEEELKRNPQLNSYQVHDLNAQAALPYASNTFDVVINTVSIEYLTDPLAIFRDVSRVLRPNGHFIITFSNRWFPTKAIGIWQQLHEFERMGLVLEYFLRTEFQDIQTYSIRGLPRPKDDKYYPKLRYSDPVYAVWGKK